jgi:hypothetical protein
MRTTENTSNRPLTDAELDEVSGGSLLSDVWNAYCVGYDVVMADYESAPLKGHLHR